MSDIGLVTKKVKRDVLKSRRKILFEEYLNNPLNVKLAAEIKLIDDDT